MRRHFFLLLFFLGGDGGVFWVARIPVVSRVNVRCRHDQKENDGNVNANVTKIIASFGSRRGGFTCL